MSMMTHEDLLRELELLPVWQLRAPLPAQTAVPQPDDMQTRPIQVHVDNIELNPGAEVRQINTIQAPISETPIPLTYFVSEDSGWLFVLSDKPLPADEALLLQNIFIALRIKAQPARVSANVGEVVATLQPKRVIAMGESVGQHLLASGQELNELRGIIHTWQATPLVVTYELAHLLNTPSDKAGTWQDLCLVIACLNSSPIEFKKLGTI